MACIAAVLVALTIFDYTQPASPRRASPPAETPRALAQAQARPSSTGAWQEIGALRQLQDNAEAVQQRYRSLAGPYAETMAGMAVLHGAEEKPEDAARRAITEMLPAAVRVKTLLVMEGAIQRQGVATPLQINLSLESGDSQAMQQAIIALGNPAGGLLWQELSLVADSDARSIQVAGQLLALAVRHAE